MRRLMIVINALATAFCLWWFAAHAAKRVIDWEFWFATGFLALCAVNLGYLIRTRRDP